MTYERKKKFVSFVINEFELKCYPEIPKGKVTYKRLCL